MVLATFHPFPIILLKDPQIYAISGALLSDLESPSVGERYSWASSQCRGPTNKPDGAYSRFSHYGLGPGVIDER